MSKHEYTLLICGTFGAGWLLVLLPCVLHLHKSWRVRRDDIFAFFDKDAAKMYFDQFRPSAPSNKRSQQEFQQQFYERHGKRHYYLPLAMLAVTSGGVAYGLVKTLLAHKGIAEGNFAFADTTFASLLGAFVWVAQDHLDRLRRRDFTRHDIFNSIFRMLIAVPFGASLGAFFQDVAGVPLAFLLGTFPTTTIVRFGRRIASQNLALREDVVLANELERLQGLAKADAERLADEGIASIQQLAWCDPLDLAIRTNIDFNNIVDWVSQSLLWIYFEEKTPELYKLSLRGAQEVVALLDAEQGAKDHVAAVITEAVKVLGISEPAVRATLMQVREDPYTKFLCAVWHPVS